MDPVELLKKNVCGLRKTYRIIGGVNGVGKSTFIGANEESTEYFGDIVNVDEITKEFAQGNELLGAKMAISRINLNMRNSINFTQESTLSGRHILKTIERAKSVDYYVHLYYIALDSEKQSIIRVNNRVLLGGHDIPTNVITKRFQKRFQDLYKVSIVVDEVSLYDNTRGFKKVASFKRNSLIKHVSLEQEPVWLKEFTEFITNK